MSKKYIELDSAIKHLLGECAEKYPLSFQNGISAAAKEIGKLPAADVTEVVRCKDCKYHRDLDGGVSCTRMDGLLMVLPDDYCSYGRRGE